MNGHEKGVDHLLWWCCHLFSFVIRMERNLTPVLFNTCAAKWSSSGPQGFFLFFFPLIRLAVRSLTSSSFKKKKRQDDERVVLVVKWTKPSRGVKMKRTTEEPNSFWWLHDCYPSFNDHHFPFGSVLFFLLNLRLDHRKVCRFVGLIFSSKRFVFYADLFI